MKSSLIRSGLMLGVAVFFAFDAEPAQATNSNVEIAIRHYGDLSMFYQGLENTGIINELDAGTHYTIFAPVNTAFVEIPQQTYPCFYSAECRAQIAELLRDHILIGRHDLADLATYGSGIQTAGAHSSAWMSLMSAVIPWMAARF